MGQNLVGWTVLGLLGISAVIGLFLLLLKSKKKEEDNINIISGKQSFPDLEGETKFLEKFLNSRKSEASRKKERNL